MRLFSWYFPMSWGAGTVVFGGAGLLMLAIATYLTWQQSVELQRWPRVDAHVESADVTTRTVYAGTVYGARLSLTYRFDGREYRGQANLHEDSDYAVAAKAVFDANQAGQVTVMLDPRHPEMADPRLWPVWTLFFAPILIGSLGLGFSGFGLAFLVMGRRQGFDKVGQASTQDPRVLWPWFAGFGALFAIAGVIGGILGPQGKSWIPAQAQVESADVVRVSVNTQPMFAIRTWLTYSLAGRTYRTAVTGETSRDPAVAGRWASAASVQRAVDVRIDRGNPFRVMVGHASPVDAVLIPAIFGGFGVLFFGIGLLIRWEVLKQPSRPPSHRAHPAGTHSHNRN